MSYVVRLEMRSHFIACSLPNSVPLSLKFRAYACKFREEILYVIKFARHCLAEGDAIGLSRKFLYLAFIQKSYAA